MPATYEPIATTTLSSAAATITFSSISGSYTDLRLILIGTSSTDYANYVLTFNSDTGTNYSRTYLRGNGTAASSARNTSAARIILNFDGFRTTTPTFTEIDIFSYAGSTNKTVLFATSEDYNGSGNVIRGVGLWRNTGAITTITLTLEGGNFSTGTTATLYGILKA